MFKKMMAVAALSSVAFTASAIEFGVVGGGVSGSNAGGLAGVTVGEKWKSFGVTAGYSQAWLSQGDQNRWTLVASYDVFKTSSFSVAGKLGYAYLNQTGLSGSAGLVGFGVEVPVNTKVAVTADYAYQFAQNSANNGNVLTAGLKYKF